MASPWKRVFAWVYDLLPAAGVFVLTLVVGLLLANVIFLDLPADQVSALIYNHPIWWLFLASGTAFYYLYCWQKGGQTVGLRTWQLKLVNANGVNLTYGQSIIRAIASLGGIGNLWAFIDGENRGWQDIIVDAYLVQLPKQAKTAEEQKPLI
jgi:uncharacterized RDD family membrane protein YckC